MGAGIPAPQSVEKPHLKENVHKREKEKFWSSFFKSWWFPKAKPLAAFRRKRNPIFSRLGREQKEKSGVMN